MDVLLISLMLMPDEYQEKPFSNFAKNDFPVGNLLKVNPKNSTATNKDVVLVSLLLCLSIYLPFALF